MHELQEDRSARLVHGVHDARPGADLLVGDDPRLVRIGLAVRRVEVRALADDQPEAAAGELGVVVGHRVGGDAVAGGADARHRRDREAVGEPGIGVRSALTAARSAAGWAARR